MTNKRKVYNQLGLKPKKLATIAKATGLTRERTAAILAQLHREGHADYREIRNVTGWVRGTGVPPKHSKPTPPPSPPPKVELKPPPSWTHPGPLIFCASEPDLANGKPGVGCIGRIVVPGVAPVWEVRDGNQPSGNLVGYVAQIEGPGQVDHAVDHLVQHPNVQRAVVSTLGTDPARLLAIGVTACFVELNPQPAVEGGGGTWDPYGDPDRMVWQAHQDGWPWAWPSYGVYGSVGLSEYAVRNSGIRKPFAVYSADGLSDTNSWAYLASL